MKEINECRNAFEKYRDYEEIDDFFLNLSRDEYLRAIKEGDNEELAKKEGLTLSQYMVLKGLNKLKENKE